MKYREGSLAALPVTVRVDEGRGAGGLPGAGEVGAPPGELHPVLLHGEALLRRVPPDLPGTSILIQYSTVQYSAIQYSNGHLGDVPLLRPQAAHAGANADPRHVVDRDTSLQYRLEILDSQ